MRSALSATSLGKAARRLPIDAASREAAQPNGGWGKSGTGRIENGTADWPW